MKKNRFIGTATVAAAAAPQTECEESETKVALRWNSPKTVSLSTTHCSEIVSTARRPQGSFGGEGQCCARSSSIIDLPGTWTRLGWRRLEVKVTRAKVDTLKELAQA